MKTEAELKMLAEELANLARNAGCKGVIIALSDSNDEHSYFYVKHKGPCLEVEGLRDRVVEEIGKIWIRTRGY